MKKAAIAVLFAFSFLLLTASGSIGRAGQKRAETVIESSGILVENSKGVPPATNIILSSQRVPSVPKMRLSPKDDLLRVRFNDYDNFTVWSAWKFTRFYRDNYGYWQFQEKVASLNNFPNQEWYFRHIGLGRFPDGIIYLPALGAGRLFDLRLPRRTSIRPTSEATPVVYLLPAQTDTMEHWQKRSAEEMAVIGSELSKAVSSLQEIGKTLNAIHSKADNWRLAPASQEESVLSSMSETLKASSDSQADILSTLEKISSTLDAWRTTDRTESKLRGVTIWNKYSDLWFWICMTLLAVVVISLLILLSQKKEISRLKDRIKSLEEDSVTYREKEKQLALLKEAVDDRGIAFVIHEDLYRDICGESGEHQIILVRSHEDPEAYIPLCGGNPVKAKNMRTHLRDCEGCRQILREQREVRLDRYREMTV